MSESTDSAESAPDLELTKRRIAIGLDVEAFMGSDGGRAFQQLALQEIDTFLNDLRTVDPYDPIAVTKLQNEIHRRELALSWLGELATAGQQAQQLYVDGES
jgi:hypothetical protein